MFFVLAGSLIGSTARADAAPEIEIQGDNSAVIQSGDAAAVIPRTDLGAVGVGGGAYLTLYVINNGDSDLTLSNPVLSGPDAAEFSITQDPTSPVASGNFTQIAVGFNPLSAGLKSAVITLVNNDSDENPFIINLQGTGAALPNTFDIVSGNNQSAMVDTAFSVPLVVRVLDDLDNPIPGATIQFAPPDQGGGLVAGATLSQTTVTTGANGEASVTATANALVGSYQVKATLPGFGEVAFDMLNTPEPGEINVTGNGQNIVSGDSAPSAADGTDFGSVAGTTVKAATFTVENTGSGQLDLDSRVPVKITGPNASEFVVTQQPSQSLAGPVSSNFIIKFRPADVGLRTATVVIDNNDPDGNENPYTIALQGTGTGEPEIEVQGKSQIIVSGDTAPSTADDTEFGSVLVSGGLVQHYFQVYNRGNMPLTLGPNAVSVSGPNAADFPVAFQPLATVAPNSSASIGIDFDPSGAGLRTATITINNNDSDESPYTFAIQGTGQSADTDAPRVQSIDQILGGSPTDADEIIWRIMFNEKVLNLTLDDFTVSGTTATLSVRTAPIDNVNFGTLMDVKLSGGDLTDLNGQVTLGFAAVQDIIDTSGNPLANTTPTGLNESTVEIINRDPDIRITGNGLNGAALSGPDLTDGQTATSVADGTDFGTQAVGTTSGRYFFSLSNTVEFSTLITGPNALTFSGPAAGDFVVNGASNRTLGGNATTGFEIRFSPSAAGPRNATVSLVSNDPDENPFTFNITGMGTGEAEMDVSGNGQQIANGDTVPDAGDHTDFGPVQITTGTIARTFTITNSGTDVLTLGADAASITGADAGEFSIVTQPAQNVAAGASTTVVVQFAPTASGAKGATLSIANDDGDESPYQFAIAGEGTDLTGSITLIVDTIPDDPQDFDFTISGGSLTSPIAATLDDDPADSTKPDRYTASLLSSGSYTVTEMAVPGYTTSISCTDPDGGTTSSGLIANVDLDPGEDIVCTFTATTDQTGPSVEILDAPATFDPSLEPFAITVLFSEDVTGFGAPDVAVTHGAVSTVNAASGLEYQVMIKPDGSGDVTISVVDDGAKDASGNGNLASNQVAVGSTIVEETAALIGSFLETRARLILQNQPQLARRMDRLNGRDTNNGGVSGFGFSLNNPELPFNMQVGADRMKFSYSLRKSLAKGAEAGVSANPEAVLSALGVQREDESRKSVPGLDPRSREADPRARTGKVASAAEASHAPDGEATETYALARVDGAHSVDAFDQEAQEPVKRFDLWVEGSMARFNTSGAEGTFTVIHAGVDYLFSPDVLLGLGAQFDWTTYEETGGNNGNAEGFGYLIGPYATVRLGDNFYLDGRAAWGRSSNQISPFGTFEDPVDATRLLVTGALVGEYDYDAFRIRPELRLNYFKEQTESYTNKLGASIPSINVETGTLEFGPTISTRFEFDRHTTVTPTVSFKGIWTFMQENSATKYVSNPGRFASEGLRGQAALGFDIANDNGSSFSLSGSYDGIGDDDYEAWGVSMRLGYRW